MHVPLFCLVGQYTSRYIRTVLYLLKCLLQGGCWRLPAVWLVSSCHTEEVPLLPSDGRRSHVLQTRLPVVFGCRETPSALPTDSFTAHTLDKSQSRGNAVYTDKQIFILPLLQVDTTVVRLFITFTWFYVLASTKYRESVIVKKILLSF